MGWLAKISEAFSKEIADKTLPNNHDLLQAQTVEYKMVAVPVKKKTYHEIVRKPDGGAIFRIYDRATSSLITEGVSSSLEQAQQVVLQTIMNHKGAT